MAVNLDFARRLPKAELHAHLTGSISRSCLHEIWLRKKSTSGCSNLEDPLTAINPSSEFVDVVSFFPLFDRYIYNLVNDIDSIKYATRCVIEEFAADGVAYLELRTTPRENLETGLTAEDYVRAVNEVVAAANAERFVGAESLVNGIEVMLILSIDRKMTPKQALRVVDLAIKYQHPSRHTFPTSNGDHISCDPNTTLGCVVGVDLCGNPTKGDVSSFTPAFHVAKAASLGITVHFAEVPQSGAEKELETILSWYPDRLGHVVHVASQFKEVLKERKLGLELCLSCNVMAKLTTAGFPNHHFGEWCKTDCPIALSTDDVGIFASPLSNEYLVAAEHFKLGTRQLIDLSKSAASVVFAGKERLLGLIEQFEQNEGSRKREMLNERRNNENDAV